RRGQLEMARLSTRFIDRNEIGEGAADIDADADHRSSRRWARRVNPPRAVNGLWISTPPSVLPCARSSVRISVQPASPAVATSNASQYDARPATASVRAVRTALAETPAQGNAMSQSLAR